ncbi:MAG TPA: DsbA family protein [Nitrolancea sp.]|nr:DsbA family protein [Nitrolancea sp.]
MSSQSQKPTGSQSRPADRKAAPEKSQRRTALGMFAGAVVVALSIVAALFVVSGPGGSTLPEVQAAAELPPDIPVNGRTIGNPDAPVKVVEWGDYQCPPCGIFAREVEPQLVSEYVATGKVHFEFRDLAFLGDESIQAAQAAGCALDQGKYWPFHDTVYANQVGENAGAFSKDRLQQIAQKANLDINAFNSCVDAQTHKDEVAAMAAEANGAGINSTPTILVNGQRVNYQGYGSLKTAIDAALKK